MNRLFSTLALLLAAGTTSHGKTIAVPRDESTIQLAINAAEAGDVVLVSAGTYHERLVLQAHVTVKSEGDDSKGELGLARAEKTIIDGAIQAAASQDSQVHKPGVEMAEAAVLDGFTIVGVGKYDEEMWNKHHATQGNEQSHEHIGAPGTPGIAIRGVNCTVLNNIVHHIGYTGIAITGSESHLCSPLVERNYCYRNMGGGIGSMNGSTATIRGNVCFENFYAGIGNDDASPLIIDNTCFQNVRAGIGISEGSCPIVRGNECHRNRRAGIGVRTGANTRPVIEENDCHNNDMAGIGVEEHAVAVISKNRCFQNKLAGIGCREQAGAILVENECFENAAVGIGHESNVSTTLLRNYCYANQEAGIGFAECESGSSVLIGNRVIDNAKVAVGIHSGWTITATNNELSRKGVLPPIVMVFAGAKAHFVANDIQGEGVAGIRVAGELVAIGNTITCTKPRPAGPPSIGIWGLSGSRVTKADNAIEGWRAKFSD